MLWRVFCPLASMGNTSAMIPGHYHRSMTHRCLKGTKNQGFAISSCCLRGTTAHSAGQKGALKDGHKNQAQGGAAIEVDGASGFGYCCHNFSSRSERAWWSSGPVCVAVPDGLTFTAILGREIKRARAVRGWKQLQLHEATS